MTGDDVLVDRLPQEVLRGDDPAVAAPHGFLIRHPEHTPEVIGVGVGVDHRRHWPFAEVGVGEGETVTSATLDGEGIDHDPPGRPLDERDVRDVVAPGLPDAGRHLEETVDVVEPGLAPQARMHRVGVEFGLVDEVITRHIPRDTPGPLDLAGRMLRDETAGGAIEVLRVHVRQARLGDPSGVGGRVLRLSTHDNSLTA